MASTYRESHVPSRHVLFQRVVQPHLKEAHRLARYLTGCTADADDVVQETSVRLLRFLHTYRGGDARSWVLRVARNSAFTWLRLNRRPRRHMPAATHGESVDPDVIFDTIVDDRAETFAIEARRRDTDALRRAIDSIPPSQREVIVLRELNELQYSEIAARLRIPIGTVMSRLFRARALLKHRMVGNEHRQAPI